MPVAIASGAKIAPTQIPFTVEVKNKVAETVRFKNDAYTDKMTVKAIRNAVTAPNGKYILFNALGQLWKKDLPNGTPQRLMEKPARQREAIGQPAFQSEPAFSPDGNSIAYVTWDDDAVSYTHLTLPTKA